MNYLLGTGYYPATRYDASLFARVWIENVIRNARPRPFRIVVISQRNAVFPPIPVEVSDLLQVVSLPGDCGHVGDLTDGSKKHEFCGWSASILAMAMTAYAAELDFIYQEGDCLAFGPYVERMYAEIGGGCMIFGNYAGMPCAQSLFLVKHAFIPRFVREYLALGGDGIEYNLPEAKFAKLEYVNPAAYRRFSFGYDRARPTDGLAKCKDPVWYVQQLTKDELTELMKAGRI